VTGDRKRLDFDAGWRPAGVVWRLPATILDMAAYCGLSLLIAVPVGSSFDWSAVGGGIDELAVAVTDSAWIGHASSMLGVLIALWFCYFVVGWGLLGATPGKWALGLRITDYRQRCPIGASRALLRLAAYCVSSVTLEWGHLMILIRADRRALHDVLAGTRVVRKCRKPPCDPKLESEPDHENGPEAVDEELPPIEDQY
jgi:uncharacterized RDD family membrane protein YckC